MNSKKITLTKLNLLLVFVLIFVLTIFVSRVYIVPSFVLKNFSERYTELLVTCEQGKFFNHNISNLEDSTNLEVNRNIQATLNDCLKAKFYQSNMEKAGVTDKQLSNLIITSLQDSRIPIQQKINTMGDLE